MTLVEKPMRMTEAASWKCRNNTWRIEMATATKTQTKFKVGMKVEWVGRSNQHRQGVITRMLNAPKTGEPFMATIQPEEIANLLDDLKVVK
jgi:hypothetical protein